MMDQEHVVLDISSDEEDTIFDGPGKLSPDYQSSFDWVVKMLELDDAPWVPEDVVVVDEISCTSSVHKVNSIQSDVAKCVSADDSDDDCKVLDGDPDKPLEAIQDAGNRSDDLLIVGERGQLACRDYPHSRHLCVTFPFSATSHEKFCKLCHCYVCDIPAPCIYWGSGSSSDDHCHSSDKEEKWRLKREALKQANNETDNTERLRGATLCIMLPGIRSKGTRTPGIRTSHNNLRRTISSSSMHGALRPVPFRTSVSMHISSGSIPAQTSVSMHAGPALIPPQNSDSRSHPLHRCSATGFHTPNIISQKRNHHPSVIHSNQRYTQHLNRPPTFSGTNSTQGEWHDSSPRLVPAHTRGRMPGTGFPNIPEKRPRMTVSNHNQVYSRKLQRNSSFPASSVDENIKKWHDVLLGQDPDPVTNFRQCTPYPQSAVYSQCYTQTSASTGTDLLSSSAPVTNNPNFLGDRWMNATTNASLMTSPLLNVHPMYPHAVPESNPMSGEVLSEETINSLGQEYAPEVAREQGSGELNLCTYYDQELWSS
uniref:1-phosphatidylinositol 4,5-bisphosphate phosphodiesterase eta-2 n=2 Tax=Anthurium amnicola TaxID=1678845 RepID=A0A1D1YBD9_9ARAE